MDLACPCCVSTVWLTGISSVLLVILAIDSLVNYLLPKQFSTIYKRIRTFAGIVGALIAVLIGVIAMNSELKSFIFSKIYITMSMSASPTAFESLRCDHIGAVSGRILELGPGTGASFRCWQNNTAITEYVGVESNKYFKSHLEDIEKSRNYSFPISTVWIKGENIDIEPNSFDYVVTTHVLCSVDSVHQILQQVKRALKTNGKYFFLEHVQDFNNNTWTFYFQQILSPIFYIFGNGCKFLPIWRNFQQFEELEGFKVEVQNFTSPHPLSVIQPHIKGVAVKN